MRLLKAHGRKHLEKDAPDEFVLLKKGHVPEKNKLGLQFKGKNKIIIS
jgi:hypothetical protein